MCSRILHGPDVKEMGLLFSGRCFSPFFEDGRRLCSAPV